ncbi:hypothetical protein SELMODRAFT_419059 [Selaginella moellendorffii]|uniref:Uncharacterized protein n=1 Tax=Selaginella moellendorffii TaxID=88036 RepID=D8S7P8_SELML|nr:hypothetical protein SELMODRAFT_419059 [Selaginella moellendorffii]
MERLVIRNNRLVRDDGKKRGCYENEEAKGGKAMIKRTKMDQQLQDKETKGEQEYLKACLRGGPTLVRLKLSSLLNPAKVEATREMPMRTEVKSKATKQLETSMTMEIECEPVDKVKGGNKESFKLPSLSQHAPSMIPARQDIQISNVCSVTCSYFTNSLFISQIKYLNVNPITY